MKLDRAGAGRGIIENLGFGNRFTVLLGRYLDLGSGVGVWGVGDNDPEEDVDGGGEGVGRLSVLWMRL